VDHFSGDVETQLIDLTDVAFSMLRGCDARWLAPSLHRVMHQVERPRANIGGSGPPGRSD
jgi:hypothetical protein